MTWRALAGAGLAALAAGPWPELGSWAWPLRFFLGFFAFWLLRPRRVLAFTFLGLVLAGWGLDFLLRWQRPEEELNQAFQRQLGRLQGELALLAQHPALAQLLAGTGAEAQPEVPFALLGEALRRMPGGVAGLVLVDWRGEPVAWTGSQPRLPLQWRPVGERLCLPESWVGQVLLFCREPVYESGRVVGAVLAQVNLPLGGVRRVLGLWAGLSAYLVPVLVSSGEGLPSLRLTLRPAPPVLWAASGGALALAPLLLLPWVGSAARPALALASAAGAMLVGFLPLPFLPALVLAVLAMAAPWVCRRWKFLAFPLVAALAWALPPLLVELGTPPFPSSLLLPPLPWLASLWGLVALVMALPAGLRQLPWLSLPFWLAGLLSASSFWLAVGVGVLLFFLGPRRRALWAAAAASCLFLGGGEGVARSQVLAKTEATLARWGEVKRVARALLASLPEGRLENLSKAAPGQRVVQVGELGEFLQLSEVLPGTALVLEDQEGTPLATWGELGLLSRAPVQELAQRPLGGGWRLRLLAPPSPHHVLAAMAAAGLGVPVAAFDRAGAPVSRGAPFRPLSPAAVGEALARERSWAQVVVGSRLVPTYLRAFEDWVLAIPWMRLPWPDTALLFFAMFLWGAAPFSLWQLRETWRWWQQRASFTGRLRALAFTATLVPLVLLGNVLPAQWVREREQAQAELARTLASAVAQGFWQESLESLVRDLGATVAVYRPSFLAITSRPDLAALGSIPLMPPAEAYVRAIRRWLEPLVVSGPSFGVFIPAGSSGEPLVIAVMGLTQVVGSRFHPGEWFAITGLWASILALWAAEGLARRLTGPMAQLVEAARLLGKGEPAPLESLSQGQDEFATLAQAFAAMAEKVQSRQRELQRQRDLFQRVLENLSAAVVLLEGEQAVLANDAAKRLGLAGGLAALEEVFGPAVRAAVAKAAAGSPRNLQLAPRGQADALWNIAAIPLVGEGGGVLVVLEDLSELARAERLASLTELARIVAHEVKNPLTPIRLWMEELQAALSKDPQKVAEVARLAVEETLQQVDRLKEVSQGFSNLVALEQWEAQEVDAVQLAGEVVEEYRVLERRGVAIQLLAGCSQLLVRVDPAWLARALRHLLENSARALGGRGGSITVQVDKEGDWGVVAVRDSAGGVAEEHLVRLFEPHFSTTSEGSGLGLAVVRRVCQKAGGRAEARNLAEGLEVRMLLPAI